GSGVRVWVTGRSLLPVPGREVLARHAGQRVRGEHVPARGVYADEGFWVGTSDGDQLWVQLIGHGGAARGAALGAGVAAVPGPVGAAGQLHRPAGPDPAGVRPAGRDGAGGG